MTKLKSNQFILDGHLFQEYPLLYQTEMVQAVLVNTKNQTRRVNGLELRNEKPDSWTRQGAKDIKLSAYFNINGEKQLLHYANAFQFIPKSPTDEKECYTRPRYGKAGDLLWLREKYRISGGPTTYFYQYFADRSDWLDSSLNKWKPSIHMPKEAARIWLMIEDIYPERLKDISHKDAIAEGIKELKVYPFAFYKDYLGKNDGYQHPIFSFNSLWISINGRESFDANPWVWVIKFRVLSKTGRPSNETILASRLSLLTSKEGKEVKHV